MAIRVSRQEGEILAAHGGELRVSRQVAEVLAAHEGELRVSRQMIETLRRAFYYEIVSQDVGLSGLAHYNKIFSASASNTLNLTQAASPTQTPNASNTLNFVQTADDWLIQQDFLRAISAMSLSQSVVYDAGKFQATFSNLAMAQSLSWAGPIYKIVTQWLPLVQAAEAVKGLPWAPIEVEHDLALSSILNRTQELDVNSTMTLTAEGWWSEVAEHDLNLSQAVTVGKFNVLESALDLDHTMAMTANFVRSLTHDSIVGHALTYYLEGACTDKQYTPFIGESSMPDSPAPPDDALPVVQNSPATDRFKLTYPALAAEESSVELRAPELDNLDRSAFNRISRETRGGKLSVFADPNWPQIQTVVATFTGLTKTEVDALSTFLVAYVGKEIRMQDWEGREWVGVATNPNEAFIQDGKRGWTTTFEFEGTLIGNFAPSGDLSLSDSIGVEVEYVRPLAHDLDFSSWTTFLLV